MANIPATRLGGKLGHAEARRTDIQRVEDFLIKPTRVSGFYEIIFDGTSTAQETLVDVTFPVWFVDRPAMSFGGELVRDIVEVGNYPTISVVVIAWEKVNDLRPGGGYWAGATLAVVATGRLEERMIVHWQAEARALRVTGSGD